MNYYDQNMKILKNNFKGLYNRVKKAEKNNEFEVEENISEEIVAKIIDKKNNFTIFIEKSRRGGNTMKIKKDDNEIYFHSKYAPEREAKRIVKDFGFSSKKQIFALGFGLGYYLNQFDKDNKYDRIIVIEPFLSIFYAALSYDDLSDFLSRNNISLIIENNEEIFDIVRMNVKINLEKEIDFLEHSPSLNIFEKEYKNIFGKIKEIINFKKIGVTTNIVHSKKWRNNILENLKYIIGKPKVNIFFDKFKNKPAICVGAGPSLDGNIRSLKDLNDKALIIAVDTAVGALINHDIQPDFIITMDAKKNNFLNHLSNHLSQLENRTTLVSELATHPLLHKNWKGKTAFFTMKRNFSQWLEKITGRYDILNTGGTVSHSMVDFAYKIGANPIILIGQDLAYTNLQSHASGTAFENKNIDKNNLIKVEGINGNVYTNKGFLSMLTFFNNYFNSHSNRKFIDATEGGVNFKGIENDNLTNVINNYCNKNLNFKSKISKIYSKNQRFNNDDLNYKLKKQLNESYNELDMSIDITKKQIKKINKVLDIVEKETEISNERLNDLELSFSKYENDLHNTKYLKYFVDRVLLPQQMKLNKTKNKYYLSKKKSLLKRTRAYLNFRKKFLIELKEAKDILEENYFDINNNNVNINLK